MALISKYYFVPRTLISLDQLSVLISGYSLDKVQMVTDHAHRERVKKYARVMLEGKRRLMEGKVVDLKD